MDTEPKRIPPRKAFALPNSELHYSYPNQPWPSNFTLAPINMGSSFLFSAIHCSAWLQHVVSNPRTESTLRLVPASTKHLVPSESDPNYMQCTTSCPCLLPNILLGWMTCSFPRQLSYIFKVKQPPNTINCSFTNKVLETQTRALQFPVR